MEPSLQLAPASPRHCGSRSDVASTNKPQQPLATSQLGSEGDVMRAVSEKALETFKQRIRRLTSRICGRSITELVEPLRRYVGMESLFRPGAKTASLARAGCVDASSPKGNSTQTLEAWHDGLSGMHSTGGKTLDGTEGGCKLQTMVVHQQSFTQRSAYDSLL